MRTSVRNARSWSGCVKPVLPLPTISAPRMTAVLTRRRRTKGLDTTANFSRNGRAGECSRGCRVRGNEIAILKLTFDLRRKSNHAAGIRRELATDCRYFVSITEADDPRRRAELVRQTKGPPACADGPWLMRLVKWDEGGFGGPREEARLALLRGDCRRQGGVPTTLSPQSFGQLGEEGVGRCPTSKISSGSPDPIGSRPGA
jgi:hypothetical protein